MKDIILEKTMTVKEVANALGVSYSSVYRAVTKLFPDKMQNGETTYLNEKEVACISKELKGDYHTSQMTFSAGEKVKSTTTELEVIGNAISAFNALQTLYNQKEEEYKAIIAQKDTQLLEQAPKVDFYDAVTGSNDAIDMGQVSKVLNIKDYGRNNLFAFLREHKVLDKRNMSYQKYIELGYFRVIESKFDMPDGSIGINLKTVVYQKGVDYIRKLITEDAA